MSILMVHPIHGSTRAYNDVEMEMLIKDGWEKHVNKLDNHTLDLIRKPFEPPTKRKRKTP